MARPRARWDTRIERDFTLGMIRDTPRTGIPPGGLYDAANVFVHRPGVLFKRGGVIYAGPKMTGGAADGGYAISYAPFPSGPRLLGIGNDGLTYTVTSGTTTKSEGQNGWHPIDKPTFFSGGAESIIVYCDITGTVVPVFYDPTVNSVQQFAGGATNITTGAPATTDYTVSLIGSPGGGSFRLTCSASPTPTGTQDSALLFITASIAYNASAANVVTAINNAIAATGLICSATGGSLPGTAVVVTMPAGVSLTVWVAALTGGSSPYPVVTNTTSGSTTVNPVSVPYGRISEAHLQRLVLANSAVYPSRLWFSPVLNVTRSGWDLANAWIDVDEPIYGLASLQESLLVFTQYGFSRLIGTIPPPDTDMTLEPISELGTTDARSITIWEGKCIYASPQGVFLTAGVAPVPLMEGRVESYWQSLFDGYIDPLGSGTTWTITTGVHQRRFLFVTVLNGSNLVTTLVCDLVKRAWTRCLTVDALMYANSHDDLFFVNKGNNRVVSCKSMFSPSAAVKNDVGMDQSETPTPVVPSWTTRALAAGIGLKAFGDAEVLLDMRDANGDDPTMTVLVAPGVEATTSAAVPQSPLAETTGMVRRRLTVSKDSECVTLAFTQTGPSEKTECYGIEWTERNYSPFAEGE